MSERYEVFKSRRGDSGVYFIGVPPDKLLVGDLVWRRPYGELALGREIRENRKARQVVITAIKVDTEFDVATVWTRRRWLPWSSRTRLNWYRTPSHSDHYVAVRVEGNGDRYVER